VRDPSGEIAVTQASQPNLEGLEHLARRNGVDIRPTLIRVLTDLYVQKAGHTPEEERRYTELVMRLLDAVDVATRAAVSHKLATYAAAPAPVIRRLARDFLEVAEPVLKHSPCLTGPELLAIIEDFGPRYAAAIAARNLSERPRAAAAAAPPPASTIPRRGGDSLPAVAKPPPASDSGVPLGMVFLAASSAERRAILSNLADPAGEAAAELPRPGADVIHRLEGAALQRRPGDFQRELQRALTISIELAAEIVQDDGGELLLLALKALDMPPDVLLRVLLFLNPAIGQSVPQVFELARLYGQFTQAAALRIMATLRSASTPGKPPPGHQPVLWNDEPGGRRPGADGTRRAAGGSEPHSARRDGDVWPPQRRQRS
jgi:hypothetical protein